MFINYFRSTERDSPFNLLVARVILGAYGIWKLSTISWHGLYQADPAIVAVYSQIALPEIVFNPVLSVLPIIAFSMLFLFLIGYKIRLTAFLGGISTGLLAVLLSFPGLYYSLTTLSHLLLIYSIFGEDDEYSFERLTQLTFSKKISLLHENADEKYRLRFLKWMLVYLSLTYFITACNRLYSGGLTEWINAYALPRTIRYTLESQGKPLNLLAELIISDPLLIIISITVVLATEIGFLASVLAKKSINLFAGAVIILHLMFALVLNLYAFNQLVLIVLLLPWDDIYRKTHLAFIDRQK
jgi:hypothetical protein